MEKYKLYCITGKSGSGKSFISDLMSSHPYLKGRFKYLTEYTTRPKSTIRVDDRSHTWVSRPEYEYDCKEDNVAAINMAEIKYKGDHQIWNYYYRKSDLRDIDSDMVCQSDPVLIPQLLDFLEASNKIEVIPVYILADEDERLRHVLLSETKKVHIEMRELTRRYEFDEGMFKPIVIDKNDPHKFYYNPFEEDKRYNGYCINNTYVSAEALVEVIKMLNTI